jgi:ketosteroid isomerase-like protein
MKTKTIYIFFIISLFWNCSENKEQLVKDRMHYYDSQIVTMNASAISQIYSEDGMMLDPNGKVIQKGRKSIKNFLKTFQNMKVLHNNSVSEKIEIKGDSAFQSGMYTQVAVVDQDTFNISGKFVAKWCWDQKGNLLLKEMQTIPYMK